MGPKPIQQPNMEGQNDKEEKHTGRHMEDMLLRLNKEFHLRKEKSRQLGAKKGHIGQMGDTDGHG